MSIHNILLCIDKKIGISISLLQSLSHVWLFATPWTAAQQASLSFTNSQNLFKLKSIELMMPSNRLILCHPPSPPALNLSPNQGLFQWVSYSHQVAKVLELRGGGGWSPGEENANERDIIDMGLIPGLGRFPGGGHSNPLQYSCLKIPWTEKPGGLQSMASQRVGHNLATKQQYTILYYTIKV